MLPTKRIKAMVGVAVALLVALLYRYRRRLGRVLFADAYSHLPTIVDEVAPDPDFIKTLFQLCRIAQKQPRGLGVIRKFGSRRRFLVILTRPEHVAKVLMNSTGHGMGVLREATQSFVGKKCLFALEGDEWRTQRLIIRNALHVDHIQTTFASSMESVTFRMVMRLAERIRMASPIIDVHAMFARMHVAVVSKAFFGDDFGFFHQELYPTLFATATPTNTKQRGSAREEILQAFEYLVTELPRLAVDERFRQSAHRNFADFDEKWPLYAEHARKACRGAIRERVRSGIRTNSVLDEVIEAQKQVASREDENALVETVTDNVVQLIFAGFNTVVVGLSFSLFYLAQNPVWWDQVRAEADAVFSQRDFSLALEKNALPVIDAVFSETLRLVPPTGFTGRVLDAELELEPGLSLPSGADVFLPIVHLAQQESVWGADASAFNPRRWLDGRAPPLGAYVPFSLGPRSCVGEAFARKLALIALSMLVHFFNFELVPGAKQLPRWTGFGFVQMRSSGAHVLSTNAINILGSDQWRAILGWR